MLGDEKFYLEERTRMGNILLSIYEDTYILGSFYLDPEKHVGEIETIRELVAGWNKRWNEEVKRERVRSDERNSRRNGKITPDT